MLELTRRLLDAARGGDPVLQAAVLEPGPEPGLRAGARLLVDRAGKRMGSLGAPALDDLVAGAAPGCFRRHLAETVYVRDGALSHRTVPGATLLYLEVVEARPVFLVVGGGHVGKALTQIAALLDFDVAVIDDRQEYASAERFPEASRVICDDFTAALERFPIDHNTHVVMVTRGHKHDEESLRMCLGRGARYVGMIGSRRRTAAVMSHLLAEGYDPAELARVRTPIGLDVGAETPAEIAVSIMAEVIMLRHGGTGSAMYYRKGERAPGNPRE